ncbi:MAG: saccharopine dehydrogenase C-terminal domain-containing protein [Acidimicrobiia bacterium]|nr:saccharopine dehydrogenase C-terminal domain-containing protein [Acidimicrobiia bacterium]
MASLVLGAGIVGSAATWDLRRRGHDVTVADADGDAADRVGKAFGATPVTVDVTRGRDLMELIGFHDLVISAVPYRFGYAVASAALATATHYLDFGGNPSVVAAQKRMHDDATDNGIMVVPDCGLAPGLANVMAEELIEQAEPGVINSIQMRVGALPQRPIGALKYQLAFSPEGLINEYAEPCEVLENGHHATVEPLARFEDVSWAEWGPLEAFSTAGGTSTMCITHADRVQNLEYKTLRYPGHGGAFRALYETGMFDESPRPAGSGIEVAPRSVLIRALDRTLPRDEPDIVLVRVWRDQHGERTMLQLEDRAHGAFSALARTTAFPASALADLIIRGEVLRPGVLAMHEAVRGSELLPELTSVGIEVERA